MLLTNVLAPEPQGIRDLFNQCHITATYPTVAVVRVTMFIPRSPSCAGPWLSEAQFMHGNAGGRVFGVWAEMAEAIAAATMAPVGTAVTATPFAIGRVVFDIRVLARGAEDLADAQDDVELLTSTPYDFCKSVLGFERFRWMPYAFLTSKCAGIDIVAMYYEHPLMAAAVIKLFHLHVVGNYCCTLQRVDMRDISDPATKTTSRLTFLRWTRQRVGRVGALGSQ